MYDKESEICMPVKWYKKGSKTLITHQNLNSNHYLQTILEFME